MCLKIKEKEAGIGPFYKKISRQLKPKNHIDLNSLKSINKSLHTRVHI